MLNKKLNSKNKYLSPKGNRKTLPHIISYMRTSEYKRQTIHKSSYFTVILNITVYVRAR